MLHIDECINYSSLRKNITNLKMVKKKKPALPKTYHLKIIYKA